METLTVCLCGHPALAGEPCCEWCAEHGQCEMPASVTVSLARLSGAPIASCQGCGMRWGYWECGCELVHDCAGEG